MAGERETENNAAPAVPGAPVISATLRRRLQQCFDHASKLMQGEKYDHDYANTLLTECVQQDPGNLTYVEKFLDNLQAKYDNNKKGARFAGFGGRGAFKKAIAKKDWLEVLKEGPLLLKTNPWDVATLRPMAEACEGLDLREVELRYLKNALDANPKDPEVNRHCAKSLQRMGQFDQAIVCWHRVEEALKHDQEAPRMISELQIEKTRARAGYGDPNRAKGAAAGAARPGAAGATPATNAGAGKPAPPSPAESAATREEPPAKREVSLTPRQKLERAIHEDPTDVDSYLQLAQLHLDEQRLADAEQVLKRALAASGNELRVREKYEDVTILRHRQQLAVTERLAAVEKTHEAQQLLAQHREELNRLELEIYRGRSERYPRETVHRYQFALRLKRAGNYAEAIVQFTELVDKSIQTDAAAVELGECYQILKHYQPALKWYRHAIDSPTIEQHPEVRKAALYRGAVLAAGLKELELAESLFQSLLELDPGFKDAADRLDKLRQIRHKEGP